jgi:hypothetical protein
MTQIKQSEQFYKLNPTGFYDTDTSFYSTIPQSAQFYEPVIPTYEAVEPSSSQTFEGYDDTRAIILTTPAVSTSVQLFVTAPGQSVAYPLLATMHFTPVIADSNYNFVTSIIPIGVWSSGSTYVIKYTAVDWDFS